MRLSIPELLIRVARENLELFQEACKAVELRGINLASQLRECGIATDFWIDSHGSYCVELPDDTDLCEAVRVAAARARLDERKIVE